jgi:hypothetical protein
MRGQYRHWTQDQLIALRAMRANTSISECAKLFGVPYTTMNYLLRKMAVEDPKLRRGRPPPDTPATPNDQTISLLDEAAALLVKPAYR